VESGNLTLAEGLIVIKAAEAAKEGKSVEEIRSTIESIIPRTHAYAKLDTIDYLKKGGRMSSIQHSVVSILGIKPILKMSNHSSSMEIARTKNKAFEKVLKTAVENLPYAEAFGITHANVPDQVEELIRRLKEMIPGLNDPMVSEVTPALGVHVGPGSLCVNWIEGEAHCAETEKKGLRKWLP
jgi:DegV family protein with EDD domain